MSTVRLGRRPLALGLGALALAPRAAHAFGEAGAFRARLLVAGAGHTDERSPDR